MIWIIISQIYFNLPIIDNKRNTPFVYKNGKFYLNISGMDKWEENTKINIDITNNK